MDVLLDFDGELLAGDIRQVGADLAPDDGLKSSVVISLFTDRRAETDDPLPAGETDRRGWWGDLLAEQEGDQIGSRLWLLAREKQLPDVLARAEEYAREALQWLIDDEIAAAVDVTAEWLDPKTSPRGLLGLLIVITKPDGDAVEYRFNHLWEAV